MYYYQFPLANLQLFKNFTNPISKSLKKQITQTTEQIREERPIIDQKTELKITKFGLKNNEIRIQQHMLVIQQKILSN